MNIKVVTIIGANGTMGRNIAAIFASFGNAKVNLVCRDMEKAQKAVIDAYKSIRTEAIKERLVPITYDNIEDAVKESDLIFESLNEDFENKTNIYKKIKDFINEDTIIASGTSGLSIEKLSRVFEDKANNFYGIHFFNPPYHLSLCELIMHNDSQKEKAKELKEYLQNQLNRTVVLTSDSPSFLGNRIGFFFINQALQLAKSNMDYGGIDYIDAILGGFTGRSMPPLFTANFVGLDISKSIIDYIYQCIDDEFKNVFVLPDYINKLVLNNRNGSKTGIGLYKNEDNKVYVYDIKKDNYRLQNKYEFYFAKEMEKNIKIGRYKEAFEILLNDNSKEAKICKEMILKYIIYSLYVANIVTNNIDSCDDAMATGFSWLPPISYIELLGGKEKVYDLVKNNLSTKWVEVIDSNQLLDKIKSKSKYDYRKFLKLD